MYSPTYLTYIILSFTTRLTLCHDRPVIGILSQETYWSYFKNYLQNENSTYIAASYVKAVEASGGRVIPVFTNKTTAYYEDVVNKVNGILIPGGASAFDITVGIGKSAYEIFQIAKRINDNNDHFPILGICLGFDLLLIATIDGQFPLTKCSAHNMNLPLNIIPTMEKESVLFKTMPDDIRNILITEPVTANHHSKCVTIKKFFSMDLDNFWNAVTTNVDADGLIFISTIESKQYPFVGLQFHPETNAYEWQKNDPHSPSAIYSARYFYDWFINECRKNNHTFEDEETLNDELIYNYHTTYIGKFCNAFEQVYILPRK